MYRLITVPCESDAGAYVCMYVRGRRVMLRAEPWQTDFLGMSPQKPRSEFLVSQTSVLRIGSASSRDDEEDEESLGEMLSGLNLDTAMPAALVRHTTRNNAADHTNSHQSSGFGRVTSSGSGGSSGIASRTSSSGSPRASPVGNFMKRSAPVSISQASSPLIQSRNLSSLHAQHSPLSASQPSSRPTRSTSPLFTDQGKMIPIIQSKERYLCNGMHVRASINSVSNKILHIDSDSNKI
jgi:hypothetical protein